MLAPFHHPHVASMTRRAERDQSRVPRSRPRPMRGSRERLSCHGWNPRSMTSQRVILEEAVRGLGCLQVDRLSSRRRSSEGLVDEEPVPDLPLSRTNTREFAARRTARTGATGATANLDLSVASGPGPADQPATGPGPDAATSRSADRRGEHLPRRLRLVERAVGRDLRARGHRDRRGMTGRRLRDRAGGGEQRLVGKRRTRAVVSADAKGSPTCRRA